MEIAIIIPAYNEEVTIAEVIRRFHSELPDASIYVVNNKSSDETGEIAAKTLDFLGCKGRVIFENRIGKGNAVRRAFREIEADYYVLVDADLTYHQTDLKKLMQPVLDNYCDMCVGDRLSKNKYKRINTRKFHGFGNSIVRRIINFLFKSKIKDVMSGYRVFNRFFVKNFPLLSEGFEIETEMTLHALDKKFRILEIPIEFQERPKGSHSKLNTFRDGYRVIKTILWIFKDYKPGSFFGFWSTIFVLAGIGTGFPVLLEYIEKQWIYRVPLAILATGLMIFAIISLAIALILDTVSKVHKWNYSLRLKDKYPESKPPNAEANTVNKGKKREYIN